MSCKHFSLYKDALTLYINFVFLYNLFTAMSNVVYHCHIKELQKKKTADLVNFGELVGPVTLHSLIPDFFFFDVLYMISLCYNIPTLVGIDCGIKFK